MDAIIQLQDVWKNDKHIFVMSTFHIVGEYDADE